jgi:hypothetical protein
MRRIVFFTLVLGIAAVGILFVIRRDRLQPQTGYVAGPDSLRPLRIAVLYFGASDGVSLVGELREVPSGRFDVYGLLDELLRGPQEGNVALLPEGVRLLSVFETRRSTLYLDFSDEFSRFELGGFSSERLMVASILKTLDVNLDTVKNVCFLIEGLPRPRISGHLDTGVCFDCGEWKALIPIEQKEPELAFGRYDE